MPRDSALTKNAPVLVLLAVCLIASGFFFSQIGRTRLVHRDEFRTAERSREMLLSPDPLTVHENFIPYFNKPPLYYWLTAPLLAISTRTSLFNEEFALRFWSAAGAIALLAATFWLVREILPGQRWAGIAAVLLICANRDFLMLGRLALLDTAQAALAMATLASTLRAARDARWFFTAAAFAGVAFMIKSPLTAAVFLASTLIHPEARRSARSREFVLALALLLLLVAWWPVIETVRFGAQFYGTFFGRQMAQRFGDSNGGVLRSGTLPLYARWFVRSWNAAGCLALAAMIGGFFFQNFRRNRGIILLVILGVSYIAGLAFVKPSFERYLLLLVPMLSVIATAAVFAAPRRGRMVASFVFAAALVATFARRETYRFKMDDGLDPRIADEIPVAQEIGLAAQHGDRIILLRDRGIATESRLYLFYGKLSDSVFSGRAKRWEELLRTYQRQRLRGIITEKDMAKLQKILPAVRVVSKHGDLIHWVYEPG